MVRVLELILVMLVSLSRLLLVSLRLIWGLLTLIIIKMKLLWMQLVSKVEGKYAMTIVNLWMYFMTQKLVLDGRNKLIKDPKINVLVKLLSLGDDFFSSIITRKLSKNYVVRTLEETIELYKIKINKLNLLENELTKQYQDKIDSSIYTNHELLSITQEYSEDLKKVQRGIKSYIEQIDRLEKEG